MSALGDAAGVLEPDCAPYPVRLMFSPESGRYVTSTRDIGIGEVAIQSQAYAAVPSDHLIQVSVLCGGTASIAESHAPTTRIAFAVQVACLRCFKRCDERSYQCSSCRQAHYCSQQCQALDAAVHSGGKLCLYV
jgi:hypothetical protein